jgi:hypothetical protein
MFAWLRQQKQSRRHPHPDQARDALENGRCLYSPISTCSGSPGQVGLHDNEDVAVVLVCKAHFGRLRRMPARDLDRLERVLRKAFNVPKHEDDDEPATLIFLR